MFNIRAEFSLVASMSKYCLAACVVMLGSVPCIADHFGLNIDGGPGSGIFTMSAQTLAKSQQMVSLQYQYLNLDELSDQKLLNLDEGLHSVGTFSHATIGYSLGITTAFTLSAVLPYVSRDDFREAEADHHHEGGDANPHHDEPESAQEVSSSNLSGWGDLSLLGRFALPCNQPVTYCAMLGGIKTPTGVTNKKLDDGDRAEVEHQPGSGSWDALLGFAYSTQLSPAWSVSSNLLYQFTTEGKEETEIGDSLQYNVALIFSPGSHSHSGEHAEHHIDSSWQYALEMNGEWRDNTTIDGNQDTNSGGDLIFTSAGIRRILGDWAAHIGVGIPVYINLNGTQSEPDWRISTGLSLAF